MRRGIKDEMRLEFVAKGTEGGDAKKKKAGLKILGERELKELQQIELMMMDDINEICSRYHIRYTLIAGSAIGALREGGFIPWDDDIDIAMPRADFDKFVRVVRKHYDAKYYVLHPRDRENEGRIIPKIRLRGTEYRPFLDWDLKECGIFIDIFLFENIPDSPMLRGIHGFICEAFGFALSCRRLWRGRKQYLKLYGGLSFRVKSAIGALLSFASIESWAHWTDFWYSACRNRHTRDISCITDTFHYFGEIYNRRGMESTRPVSFCGRKYRVAEDIEPYLRHRYGDFMTPPDENHQVRNWYLAYDPGKYACREIPADTGSSEDEKADR